MAIDDVSSAEGRRRREADERRRTGTFFRLRRYLRNSFRQLVGVGAATGAWQDNARTVRKRNGAVSSRLIASNLSHPALPLFSKRGPGIPLVAATGCLAETRVGMRVMYERLRAAEKEGEADEEGLLAGPEVLVRKCGGCKIPRPGGS